MNRKANYDQWAARQANLGSVGEALGGPARSVPAYVPGPPSPTFTGPGAPSGVAGQPPTPTPGAPSATPAGDPVSTLHTLLASGMDPAAAANKVNQQFNLQPGSSAKYYPPDPATGTPAVVGLPSAYIANQGGNWTVTTRGGGATAQAPAAASPANYNYGNVGQLLQSPGVTPNLTMPTTPYNWNQPPGPVSAYL